MKDLCKIMFGIAFVLLVIGIFFFSHTEVEGYRQSRTWNDPEFYWLIAPFFILIAIGWIYGKFKN